MTLDNRVTALIEDMQSGRLSNPDGSLDCDALNDRIKALHGEVDDEESRVELIALHDALMRTSDARLVEQGRDPGPLREEWRRTHLSFLLAESLTDGEVDGAKLARVNAREVAAGRLRPEEAVHIRRVDPEPYPPRTEPGLMKKMGRSFSRLFGASGPAAPAADPPAPERDVPVEPPPLQPAGDTASEIERAYRAILLWEEERMRPRLDALAADFRARLQRLELRPGEDFQAAAERETLETERGFEENEPSFVAEAVSYLDDDVLEGLKALGVDSQFGSVIWQAVDEARADLARRLGEAREAAYGESGAGAGS